MFPKKYYVLLQNVVTIGKYYLIASMPNLLQLEGEYDEFYCWAKKTITVVLLLLMDPVLLVWIQLLYHTQITKYFLVWTNPM